MRRSIVANASALVVERRPDGAAARPCPRAWRSDRRGAPGGRVTDVFCTEWDLEADEALLHLRALDAEEPIEGHELLHQLLHQSELR